MKQIDESRLETDLEYRFGYMTEFMGFGKEDIKVIHGAAELLAPVVEDLVNAVYDKLLEYDCTRRHFLPAPSGSEGESVASLDEVSSEHEHLKLRKMHLKDYFVKLVTAPYDAKLVKYLDKAGRIHTAKAGKAEIDIPLVHMNATMGFVGDAINSTILGLDIPYDAKVAAIRAFSKLLWLQNDLITRHYTH